MEWRNWGSSVLREVSKILMNAAIVNGLKSLSGAGGSLVRSAVDLGAVANAKGGVYASANLSAYSNTIVDTPTYFAFAKGAGLMGEAGPEAIMPLTRAADGSLGVRAIGNVNGGGGFVILPCITLAFRIWSNGEIDTRSARGTGGSDRQQGCVNYAVIASGWSLSCLSLKFLTGSPVRGWMTRKPSVITVKFGDGYEQRRAGG